MNNLHTIKKICGYDVAFLRLEINDNAWISAYIRLDNLMEDEYEYETYREGNVVGIDTMHFYNQDMTFDNKILDAERQIKFLIHDYESKINNEER